MNSTIKTKKKNNLENFYRLRLLNLVKTDCSQIPLCKLLHESLFNRLFWTPCCVYLFDSVCKKILVNYNSTCSLQFFKFFVLSSRIMLFKIVLVLLYFESENVQLSLASTSSEHRLYI